LQYLPWSQGSDSCPEGALEAAHIDSERKMMVEALEGVRMYSMVEGVPLTHLQLQPHRNPSQNLILVQEGM
jgi:hypothetical protein